MTTLSLTFNKQFTPIGTMADKLIKSIFLITQKGDIFPETLCVFHTSFFHSMTGDLFLFETSWSKSFKWDSDWFSHFPPKYFYSNFLYWHTKASDKARYIQHNTFRQQNLSRSDTKTNVISCKSSEYFHVPLKDWLDYNKAPNILVLKFLKY